MVCDAIDVRRDNFITAWRDAPVYLSYASWSWDDRTERGFSL